MGLVERERVDEVTGAVYTEQVSPYGEIQKLWSRQKQILRLYASGLYQKREIADFLGVSESTIQAVVNSALGREYIDMLNGAIEFDAVDLMKRIKTLSVIALSQQEEMLLDPGTPKQLKNQIAEKLLDRAGYGATQKNINLNANIEMTVEEVNAIKNRAAELKALYEGRRDNGKKDDDNIADVAFGTTDPLGR